MGAHLSGTGMVFEVVFLTLQGIVVLFLLLHDWIPLGRLNNLDAIRGRDSLGHRVYVTLLPLVPAAVCLYLSAERFGQRYPMYVEWWLWVTYGTFVLGMLRAWWLPYLVLPDAKRAERYQAIFAGTHTFLPQRNGIAPDTLHTVFHAVVLVTLILFAVRERLTG
jgi:hypothetical protein